MDLQQARENVRRLEQDLEEAQSALRNAQKSSLISGRWLPRAHTPETISKIPSTIQVGERKQGSAMQYSDIRCDNCSNEGFECSWYRHPDTSSCLRCRKRHKPCIIDGVRVMDRRIRLQRHLAAELEDAESEKTAGGDGNADGDITKNDELASQWECLEIEEDILEAEIQRWKIERTKTLGDVLR